MGRLCQVSVKIANGASLSSPDVDLRDHRIVAIQMPAAFTDPVNGLTFQSTLKTDGASNAASLTETFLDVLDDAGTEVAIANASAQAGKYVVLGTAMRDKLDGLARTIIRSGKSGSVINQGAAREIILVCEIRGD